MDEHENIGLQLLRLERLITSLNSFLCKHEHINVLNQSYKQIDKRMYKFL